MSQNTLDNEDLGVIAWHEDGHWILTSFDQTRDLESLVQRLTAQRTNGGALAMISIDDDFFILIRVIGQKVSMMMSDITFALDYGIAADVLEYIDLPYPGDEDEPMPGGTLTLLEDLGVSEMELVTICDDLEMYPIDQLAIIATQIGFGKQFDRLAD